MVAPAGRSHRERRRTPGAGYCCAGTPSRSSKLKGARGPLSQAPMPMRLDATGASRLSTGDRVAQPHWNAARHNGGGLPLRGDARRRSKSQKKEELKCQSN